MIVIELGYIFSLFLIDKNFVYELLDKDWSEGDYKGDYW